MSIGKTLQVQFNTSYFFSIFDKRGKFKRPCQTRCDRKKEIINNVKWLLQETRFPKSSFQNLLFKL